MEKSTLEQIGGTYRKEGDYFSPKPYCAGKCSRWYLGPAQVAVFAGTQEALYNALLFSGKLDNHLSDTDRQAEDMFFQIVKQMAAQEGITEQLKADSQMEWVGHMNNICDRVTEIINAELIFI